MASAAIDTSKTSTELARIAVPRFRFTEQRADATGEELRRRRRSPQLFLCSLIPDAEQRGAAGLVYPAAGPSALEHGARWVVWRSPERRHSIWGLYVSAELLGDAERAANDAWRLIAWGEGPVLVWVDDARTARELLRDALGEPPAWLRDGMRSGDPTFLARLDPIVGVATRRQDAPPCAAVVPPSRHRARAIDARDVVTTIARAWRVAMSGFGAENA